MLGLAFTEFVSMLDEEHSANFTEELIAAVGPASGGAYTAFGSYPSEELEALVAELCRRTNCAPDETYLELGRFIVSVLAERYPQHFSASSEPFAFLCATQSRLQREARKLYREEDLPSFSARRINADAMQLDCDLDPVFAGVLLGGVMGVLDYFEADVDVEATTVFEGGARCQRFILRRRQSKVA